MARQQLKHVVKKANAGLDVIGSSDVQVNGKGDLGFRGFAV
jgi:hypothetical protein